MENNETGFALGLLGGTHDKEDQGEKMREYERRKANADKIESALMTACLEVSGRLERDVKSMTNKEISDAIGVLLGLSTALGTLSMYAVKPYISGFGGCGCK